MPKLPTISGIKAAKAFEKAGWKFARQKGSHMIYEKIGYKAILSIQTIKSLIRVC